jgi:hypothetical protein
VKGALLRDEAANDFTSNVVSRATSSGNLKTFLGEVDVIATLHVTKHLALNAGYTGLWLDNVASPGKSAQDTTQVAGGTSSPIGTDHVWFNGVTAGAAISF